jgi:EpsI family protein
VQRWLLPTLCGAVLLGVLLFIFPFDTGYSTERSPLGFALWSAWTTSDQSAQDYSYCLLIPLVVGYLVYERRQRLAQAPIHGSVAAIGLILLGLILFWIGSKAGKQFAGCLAVQILLAGMVLWFWGGKVFRLLLFAWVLITFAWPMPFLDSAVAFPLRMIVSQLAHGTLILIGIPSIRNGTALYSPADPIAQIPLGAKFEIDVADPCSGIHSLVALLMFSALYGYFFLPRRWQQLSIFLSAIPLTILGNVVRILLLVIASITCGSPFAIGTNDHPSWFHEGCGFAVFIVVLGSEFFLGSALVKLDEWWAGRSGDYRDPVPDVPPPPPEPEQAEDIGTVPPWRGYVLLGLTVVMVIAFWIRPPPELPPEAGVVMELPGQVVLPELPGGRFLGSPAEVTSIERKILPKDTEFARMNYNDDHGHSVFFSIVLSGLQQYSIHRPEVCLVAQGWRIMNSEDYAVHLASGHDLTVRNLTIQHNALNAKQEHCVIESYFMYWYVAEGVTTPSHNIRDWVSSWDRVVHNRDHRWAYVIAMAPITASINPNGVGPEQTRDMLSDFIRQIVPLVQKDEQGTQVTELNGGG